jgi:hypothetical protein
MKQIPLILSAALLLVPSAPNHAAQAEEVIAINQDPLGSPARWVVKYHRGEWDLPRPNLPRPHLKLPPLISN